MGLEKKSRPLAKADRSTNQTIPNLTYQTISFDTETYDTDGMFTPTNTKVYAKRFGGYYLVIGSGGFQPNATGYRIIFLRKNGTTSLAVHDFMPNGTYELVLEVEAIVYMNVNDYVELMVLQSSGGNLDTAGGGGFLFLTLAHLSGR